MTKIERVLRDLANLYRFQKKLEQVRKRRSASPSRRPEEADNTRSRG